MPTKEQLVARRRAKTRRRRIRSLMLWTVVIAAAVVVIVLVKTRAGNLHVSKDDTQGTSQNTTANPVTATGSTTASTAPTTHATTAPADGHYVQKSVPSWELRLVNPWNPLPDNYDYTANLADYASNRQFDARAMAQLKAMITAGSAYNLRGVSLFRDYALQTKNYNKEVTKWKNSGYTTVNAEKKAATIVARPGTSEHHLGLAADILGSGFNSLEQDFDTTEAYAWLKEHCAEYGFILRYPKDKEDVTGVIYEPWHYRYVGVEIATVIMQRGITLEEYLEEQQL